MSDENILRRVAAWNICIALATLAGCGAAPLRRFAMQEPLWSDPDERSFTPRPPPWYSPYIWDGIDNAAARPLAELFAFELDREAINVNALDEVPSSSWFSNRLSTSPLSPERVARGACEDENPGLAGVDDDVGGPFLITRGKPDGSSRGFFVRDTAGRTYLMKPDGQLQPERGSAADAIGAAAFWAAGYYVPCNRVVYVDPSTLTLEPGAESVHTDGRREPLTRRMVDQVISDAAIDARGRRRFGLSRFIDGDPISPWRYEGTWDDDPNDVVPHEHRRDLRGMFVLAAWLSHIDSRQENTLASWIEAEGGRGHVRHYVIDFSDMLGILHPMAALAHRFGHSGYIDFQHIVEDFGTLGLVDRPWHHTELGAAGPALGYFDDDDFDPERWHPGYPNPAFDRMTERDAAWMARIVARFSDAHVRALVARGRFSSPVVRSELERILRGRRDRILERYLTRLSPLTAPRLEDDPSNERGHLLCLEDRAVSSGFRARETRHYEASAWGVDSRAPRTVELSARQDGVCVRVGTRGYERDLAPDYLLVDVAASSEGAESTPPVRVHAYERDGGIWVVGLERLEHAEEPPS